MESGRERERVEIERKKMLLLGGWFTSGSGGADGSAPDPAAPNFRYYIRRCRIKICMNGRYMVGSGSVLATIAKTYLCYAAF